MWDGTTPGKLTRHLFRVGGASLRWNLETPLEEIVSVGRWKSKAYKLYIRKYDDKESLNTVFLLKELQKNPVES